MATKTQTVQLMLVTTVKGQQVLTPVQMQLKGIGQAAQAAIPPVQQLQNRLNGFSNAIAKSISNIRGTIVGLGTAMAIIGTFQMFKSSIVEAIEFEKQMANVSTILQSTGTSLDTLKQQIIELDGSLGSSSEQAKALYQALSTGVEAANAVKFVADSARFAKANLADLDATTLLLATTMNTYGDRISSVAHLTDVFSETIRAGAITGEQLVASLGTVINTAANANISIEELAAAIATLTTVGIPAQQATTALNQAMLGFISPSKEALKIAKELKIELTAEALARDGLVKSMQNLAKVAQGNIALTAELFGETRALKGVLALTGEQMEFFAAQTLKNKTGVDGLTNAMHKLQQQSLSAQFETAVNNVNKALNELWQHLIDKLTPAIVSFSESFVRLINDFKRGELDDELYKIRDAILAVGIAWTLLKIPAMIASFQALWKVIAGTALGTVLTNTLFNFQAAAKGAISYAGALSMLGNQVGLLLRTPIIGITVILYGAVKVLEMLRLIGQLKEETGDLALAQANAGGAALILAKKLHALGEPIKWHLLNEPKYVEALMRKAQTIRQADAHVSAYQKSLEAANDSNKKFDGSIKDVGDEAEKLSERFRKLNLAIIDVKENLDFKASRIGSDTFQEYYDAIAALKEVENRIQKLQSLPQSEKVLELLQDAKQDFQELGSAAISATNSVATGINNVFFPLRELDQLLAGTAKELDKAGEDVTQVYAAYAEQIVKVTELELALGHILKRGQKDRYQYALSILRAVQYLELYNQEEAERKQLQLDVLNSMRPLSALQIEYNKFLEEAINLQFNEIGVLKLWADAIISTAIAEEKLTGTLSDNTAELLKNAQAIKHSEDRWKKLAGFLSSISQQIGDQKFISGLLDSLSAGFSAFDSILEKIRNKETDVFGESFTKMRAWAAAAGAAMGMLAEAVGGAVGKILNYGSILLMGFATGGTWGLALAAIVVGISAIIDSIETGSDRAKAAALRFGFVISDALSEQIHEAYKNMVSTAEDEIILGLDLIANEIGVTSANLQQFVTGYIKALDTFAVGSLAMIEITKDLETMLPRMFEAGTDSLGNLNAGMLELIERIQQTGIEVKALTAFMDELFSKSATALSELIELFGSEIDKWYTDITGKLRSNLAELVPKNIQDEVLAFFDKLAEKGLGYEKILERLQKKFPSFDFSQVGLVFTPEVLAESKNAFEDYFVLIMAQINEMIAQGRTLPEIFEQLGGAMETLRDAAKQLGLESDPAFRPFFNLFRIMKSGLAKDLANVNTLLTSFHNLGILNAQTFGALENIFKKVFEKFNADGKISRAEMIAMAPTLAQLRFHAQQYGFALDSTTQAAIDLAIKQGFLSEEVPIDPMTRLADLFEDRLIPLFEQAFGVVGTYTNSLLAIPETVSTDVITNYTTTGSPPQYDTGSFPKKKIPSFQGIHEPVNFRITTPEQMFLAHRGEEVNIQPSANNARMNSTIIENKISLEGMKVVVSIDGKEFDGYVTQQFEDGHIAPKIQHKQLQRNA